MTSPPLKIRVQRLEHAKSLPLPECQTVSSAGADLRAAVPATEPLTLASGSHTMIPTGLALEIPPGWEGQVRPRSGLAAKHGVTVLNSPGTIDSDYRGEVKVILINHGSEPFTVERGDRIAQLVLAPVAVVERGIAFEEVERLEHSERGEGGFGSTGRS